MLISRQVTWAYELWIPHEYVRLVEKGHVQGALNGTPSLRPLSILYRRLDEELPVKGFEPKLVDLSSTCVYLVILSERLPSFPHKRMFIKT